jgi:hypothetical protein
MLQEAKDVKQIEGENRRRWFWDETMDLTVWLDDQDGIAGFELCYDKDRDERALRWKREGGFIHERVDDGEGRPGRYKAAPVLVPDGLFEVKKISRLFHENSRDIDQQIAGFVEETLRSFPLEPDR